jgi:hypothetical protein
LSRHREAGSIKGDTMKTSRAATSLCVMIMIALAYLSAPAEASELYALGGGIESSDPHDNTYSWQLEYRQDLLKHLAAGVSYLNEGHIMGHHRDGYTAQLWGRTDLVDDRLTLAAGIGPYFFLDTVRDSNPNGFTNDHGLKAMLSVAAAWHTDKNFLLELRSNWVKGSSGFDSASVLAGIGYHFDPDLEPVSAGLEREPKNEVTVFMGQTIVNSFDSQRSFAAALEYRRRLSRHIDWTVGGLYEGDNRLIRRDGVITQLWATQDLAEGMFNVGAGAGAYFDAGHYKNPGSKFASGILTLTGSYRMTDHWALRVSWNRLVTSYDRDTDVILGGVGYRF